MIASHCQVDPSIKRLITDGFQFPLGVYPIEPVGPKPGYTVQFESADGDGVAGEEGEWEEWPDRYVFDIVVSHERLDALCRRLFSLLPGRIFPILDVLGRDAYREIDPFISYELIGSDLFSDSLRRYREFFTEDGLCGFGAMSDDPFFYVFVDEHKIVTVRAEPSIKDRIEKLLEAFDLEPIPDPAGADAAAHEHRTVLLTPEDDPSLLNVDEIVERLRDEWQLVLNIDPDSNVDDEGNDLGSTAWRCIIRCEPPSPDDHADNHPEDQPPDDPAKSTANPSDPPTDPAPPRGHRPEPASDEQAEPEHDPFEHPNLPAPRPLLPPKRRPFTTPRYAEVVLEAVSLRDAEEIAFEAIDRLSEPAEEIWEDAIIIAADRVHPTRLKEILSDKTIQNQLAPARRKGKRGVKIAPVPDSPDGAVIHLARWLDPA